jgi:hypothetical protein
MCVPMLILWSKKTHNLPFGKKLESGAVGMYLVGSSTDGIPLQTPTRKKVRTPAPSGDRRGYLDARHRCSHRPRLRLRGLRRRSVRRRLRLRRATYDTWPSSASPSLVACKCHPPYTRTWLKKGERRERHNTPPCYRRCIASLASLSSRRRLSDRADEPSSRRLSLNRSQYGGCSTKYNTPAGT